MSEADGTAAADRLAELRSSARGWHGVQLAVLGFIGLCGVLKREAPSTPAWLQDLSGALVVVALVTACAATVLVGLAAWPLYGPRGGAAALSGDAELARTSRRLTAGLALTFVAVALLGVAALSGWWPSERSAAGAGATAVQLEAGSSAFCGRLADSRPGTVGVVTTEGAIEVPIDRMTALRPVAGC